MCEREIERGEREEKRIERERKKEREREMCEFKQFFYSTTS